MKKIFLLVFILSLSACSVQKRKYQKGYYFDWVNHTTVNKEKSSRSLKQNATKPLTCKQQESHQEVVVESVNTEAAKLTNETTPVLVNAVKPKAKFKLANDSCDKILKRDGDEINGKVIEVTPGEVVYKRCDMPDGPSYRLRKSEIFMITYSSGRKEKFEESKPQGGNNTFDDSGKSKQKKKDNDYALYSLICGVAGFVLGVGSIPAIILGILALRQMKRNPDKYEGRSMAVIGLVLGILKMALLFLFVVLLLALL